MIWHHLEEIRCVGAVQDAAFVLLGGGLVHQNTYLIEAPFLL